MQKSISDNKFNIAFDVNKFDIDIGAGGFGVIKASSTFNDTVVKFIYNQNNCNSAQIEFNTHKCVYDAYKHFIDNCHHFKQLGIIEPLEYSNKEFTDKNGESYKCYYLMKKIPFICDVLFQLSFNTATVSNSLINKLVGKDYDLPVGPTNPARGFFVSYDFLQHSIFPIIGNDRLGVFANPRNVIIYIGLLTGIILFGAEYDACDVEYVLAKSDTDNTVSIYALDFGMMKPISYKILTSDNMYDTVWNIWLTLDVDLYKPSFDFSVTNYNISESFYYILGMYLYIKFLLKLNSASYLSTKVEVFNKLSYFYLLSAFDLFKQIFVATKFKFTINDISTISKFCKKIIIDPTFIDKSHSALLTLLDNSCTRLVLDDVISFFDTIKNHIFSFASDCKFNSLFS